MDSPSTFEALEAAWERHVSAASGRMARVIDDETAYAAAADALWSGELSLLAAHGWTLQDFVGEMRRRRAK